METYRPRVADAELTRLLGLMGAVVVDGPKWCGKTWLARHQAGSEVLLQDPVGNYRNRRVARDDPAALLAGARPRLIDEWQDAPAIWDAVRLEVDRTGARGQFILTASSTPRDDATAHSGTGRVARMRLWPLSSRESGLSSGTVSLRALMAGESLPSALGTATELHLVRAMLRGGWPQTQSYSDSDAIEVARQYIQAVANSDASRLDGALRDPARLSALLSALGRNAATLATNATLANDIATWDPVAVSPRTLADYLSVLERLHVLVSIPAWAPALRSPVRLRTAPKRMLVDPSLAAAAMGADSDALAADPKTCGLLFESMALRDLAVYASANGARLYHYRDNTELEVDAILAGPGKAWAAVEIKWTGVRVDAAAAALIRLRDKMMAGGEPSPQFLAVLVGVGEYAHVRHDGVHVIPIDSLGP